MNKRDLIIMVGYFFEILLFVGAGFALNYNPWVFFILFVIGVGISWLVGKGIERSVMESYEEEE